MKQVISGLSLLCTAMVLGVGAAAAPAPVDPPAVPVKVTYQCRGNVRIYAERHIYELAQVQAGFKLVGFPKTQNTEIAVLNAAGFAEYLIHPAIAECGCISDDMIFVTQFTSGGAQHRAIPQGPAHFQLQDRSGELDCDIKLDGVKR